jgi:CRP/FNR family transcriptional regulator, cyclic AMP receptor protein
MVISEGAAGMSRTASAAALAHIVRTAKEAPAEMGAEWVPVLQDVPLFAGLSKRHLRRVAGLAGAARFSAGATVVRSGARGETFYVILDGTASVRSPTVNVQLGPMDFFGEMSLLDGGPRAATVVAEEDMLTMRLSRAPFMKVLDSEPAIARGIMKELVRRVRLLEASPSA